MTEFFKKHTTIVLMSLLLVLLALAWIFPSAGLKLGLVFLFLSFCIASLVVLEKHRNAYRNGEITRNLFLRNAVVEISGTWVVMLLAGLLGRHSAELTTRQIDHTLLRLIAGILVALLVGLGVGGLGKRTLRRLVDVAPIDRTSVETWRSRADRAAAENMT